MNHKELVKLKKDIQSFLIHEVYPLEKKVLTEGYNKSLEMIEKKRDKVKSLGYWIPQISKKYGSMGLSLIEFSEISSILGSSPIGLYLFNCQAPDAGNMEILIEYGTNYQKDKFLKPLLDGKIRSCFSMTEPNHAGSNPVFMSTTAIKKNDSSFSITYNNIGAVYNGIKEYDNAVIYYVKALDIDLKNYGKNHPDVATRYN